ncbi:hypothetical protein MNBD_GAMMA23-757 [hydrothermal vent metagenome]|uniref:DUF560 domain-containing protein n=1 Tax=hydrothermal vent metagenome TaxID=652676 RepID=A0A3B1A288_9ZZZZ
MMMHAGLWTFLYYTLFLASVLLPVRTVAESTTVISNVVSQSIESESLDDDLCFESEEEALPDNPSSEELFFSFLDTPHQVISSGVEIFAKSLDEFFSEDKVFYDASGTYLRLRADAVRDENGDINYTGDVRLKLRLPNTKKKLKFTIESDADKRRDNTSAQTESTPRQAVKEKDYFAGFQISLGKEKSWQFKPSIGLRLNSGVELYTRLRLKRRYKFEKWSIHLDETPFWFNSTGVGLDSYLEFNRKISKDDLFRASTFARWTNKTDYVQFSQTFFMFHTLSKRRAMFYYVSVNDVSKSNVFEKSYLIGSTYRQNIHKGYLFVELIPQIRYQEKNDFRAEYSLTLRLEIIFKK